MSERERDRESKSRKKREGGLVGWITGGRTGWKVAETLIGCQLSFPVEPYRPKLEVQLSFDTHSFTSVLPRFPVPTGRRRTLS